MRARTDAGIFLAAPIDEVVFALGARPRVVGNLVGRKAVRGADILRHVVQRAGDGLVGRLQFACGMQSEERRAFLDGELIERQMLGGFRNRQLQFVGPHLRRLVGAGVDQVERVAVECRARDRHRIERLARAVQASQRFQRSIIQRLHAERHPVDAGGAIAAERVASTLVGLASSVTSTSGATGQCLPIASRIAPTVCGCHQRRRAAAEKDRRDFAARRARGEVSISRAKAATKRGSSIGACRTWLLKSQYGHFDRQNGQCT